MFCAYVLGNTLSSLSVLLCISCYIMGHIVDLKFFPPKYLQHGMSLVVTHLLYLRHFRKIFRLVIPDGCYYNIFLSFFKCAEIWSFGLVSHVVLVIPVLYYTVLTIPCRASWVVCIWNTFRLVRSSFFMLAWTCQISDSTRQCLDTLWVWAIDKARTEFFYLFPIPMSLNICFCRSILELANNITDTFGSTTPQVFAKL